MPQVFATSVGKFFFLTLQTSAFTAGLAATITYLGVAVGLNAAVSSATRALASRPVDAVKPKAAGLIDRAIMRRRGLPETRGARIDVFEGFWSRSPTLELAYAVGCCLEPEYPDCRTLYVYDAALPVRSGDLAIAEHRHGKPKRRTGGMFGSGILGGAVEMERSLLTKYAELRGDEWVLHSNDEPFVLGQFDRLVGRVVMAVVVPEGSQLHAKLRALDAEARAA